MKIRKGNYKDINILKDLWYECFLEYDSKESIDNYFRNNLDLNNTFVLEKDKEIRSSLQLNQHQLNYDGRIINVSFVVGVSTFIKDRKKGYMKKLFNHAIDYAKNVLNQEFMIIQGYDWDIYRNFGFYEAYYKNKIVIETNKLNEVEVSDLEITNSLRLLNIYNNYITKLNAYKIRTLDYYDSFIKINEIDNFKIICSNNAYACFIVENNMINVVECAYENKYDLFALLKNLNNYERIIVNTDLINFEIEEKILFMMVKDLSDRKFTIKKNNYISECI